MALFRGVGAAMVTPFGKDGKIDYDVLSAYIEHLISGGVAALFPFGTTGEPATVTADEYEKTIRFVLEKVNKRVPVIVGAGSNSTAVACEHVKTVKRLGADGALVVTPYYNKCTQNGLIEHYKAVASIGLPIIAYNVPSRTCVNIAPPTLTKLAAIDGIVGVKEASGDIDQFLDAAKACNDAHLPMYCGDDSLTTIAMAMGCYGVISVAANPAPRQMSDIVMLCDNGDYAKARELQFRLNEFIHSLFCEVNPIPVKKAMQLIGYDVGSPRLPLTELEPQHTERLKAAMSEIGLI